MQPDQRLDVIRRSVVREMAALGREFHIEDQVVRGPGRTAVAVREHRDTGGYPGAAPHLDLGYALRLGDGEGPVVWDCVSGLGRTEEQRLENGVRMWRTTTASAVVELLEQRGLHGDVYPPEAVPPKPPGRAVGVPGWHTVQGPACVFGFRNGPLSEWVADHHLLPAVAGHVLPRLDGRALHGVRFFFGGRADDEVAEVRLNGEPLPAASEALRATAWPRGEHLAWARCFLLLTRDPDALRDAETPGDGPRGRPGGGGGGGGGRGGDAGRGSSPGQPVAPGGLLRKLLNP
ncbi:DUF6348 family protein [Streptacidiphilus rugosus]|uniref:DUF6348 family protein n=1 Tax=Streptacidiphilus rugosus TaxID=405783 RepID=UPI0005674678|nr:DUF6348 family protein [Streptacidiphilus rugosus]